jgi:hypothetical protein
MFKKQHVQQNSMFKKQHVQKNKQHVQKTACSKKTACSLQTAPLGLCWSNTVAAFACAPILMHVNSQFFWSLEPAPDAPEKQKGVRCRAVGSHATPCTGCRGCFGGWWT